MTTYLLVCGPRWPKDWGEDKVRRLTAYVFGALDMWLADCPASDVEVVHGGCEGSPDALAALWAEHRKHRGVRTQPFPVTPEEWKSLGAKAGPMRNERMAVYCATQTMVSGASPSVIAFWDGASRGTSDMVERCEARGWRPHVLKPEILQRR